MGLGCLQRTCLQCLLHRRVSTHDSRNRTPNRPSPARLDVCYSLSGNMSGNVPTCIHTTNVTKSRQKPLIMAMVWLWMNPTPLLAWLEVFKEAVLFSYDLRSNDKQLQAAIGMFRDNHARLKDGGEAIPAIMLPERQDCVSMVRARSRSPRRCVVEEVDPVEHWAKFQGCGQLMKASSLGLVQGHHFRNQWYSWASGCCGQFRTHGLHGWLMDVRGVKPSGRGWSKGGGCVFFRKSPGKPAGSEEAEEHWKRYILGITWALPHTHTHRGRKKHIVQVMRSGAHAGAHPMDIQINELILTWISSGRRISWINGSWWMLLGMSCSCTLVVSFPPTGPVRKSGPELTRRSGFFRRRGENTQIGVPWEQAGKTFKGINSRRVFVYHF